MCNLSLWVLYIYFCGFYTPWNKNIGLSNTMEECDFKAQTIDFPSFTACHPLKKSIFSLLLVVQELSSLFIYLMRFVSYPSTKLDSGWVQTKHQCGGDQFFWVPNWLYTHQQTKKENGGRSRRVGAHCQEK